MPAFRNLTGQQFGRLTVIKRAPNKNNKVIWLCRCSDGILVEVIAANLLKGNTKSCGCLQRDIISDIKGTHRQKGTRLYRIWSAMKERCRRPKNIAFHRYGGRGITYCKEWESFEPFMEWAQVNGYQDNLELDRRENELGYSPDNCRWVTHIINGRNKQNNVRISAFGEIKTLAEWGEDPRCLISKGTIQRRIKAGWPSEKAISTPRLK
jgi:hypothetical protein